MDTTLFSLPKVYHLLYQKTRLKSNEYSCTKVAIQVDLLLLCYSNFRTAWTVVLLSGPCGGLRSTGWTQETYCTDCVHLIISRSWVRSPPARPHLCKSSAGTCRGSFGRSFARVRDLFDTQAAIGLCSSVSGRWAESSKIEQRRAHPAIRSSPIIPTA
jgi:hypothetical protein